MANRRPDYDAIAVGGGLAGAAFALELARAGARVAVIERTASPTLKVCGDFLSREAQELLAHLGLDVWAMGAAPVSTLRLLAGTRTAATPLPFAAAGMSRLRLDEALLERAAAAGVDLIRGDSAAALEADPSDVRVRVGERLLTARAVALTTGKHNLRGLPRAPGRKTAYKIQLELTAAAARDLAGVVQLAGYAGGYIGACRIEGGAATLCWLVDQHLLRTIGSDWKCQLDWIARGTPALGDLLAGARCVSDRPAAVSGLPFGYRRRGVIAHNVYPAGDQLAVIPSFTGDGTSLALSSGIAAAQACRAGIAAGAFQRAFLRRISMQLVAARCVDAAFANGTTQALGVRAIAAMPALARLIAGVTRVPDVASLLRKPAR